MRRALIPVLLSVLPLLAPGTGRAALEPGPVAPRLLLDTEGLADEVDPGHVLTALGDVALFYTIEQDEGEKAGPFYLEDDTVQFPLWRTDGTPEGTYRLLPPNASLFFWSDTLDGVAFVAVCNAENPIFLLTSVFCDSPAHVELWRTDGTREGTHRLLPENDPRRFVFRPGAPTSLAVPELGLFFFVVYGEDTGREILATEGTRESTRRVKNLADAGYSYPGRFVRHRGELIFQATLSSEAEGFPNRFGRSDGTSAGTTLFPGPLDEFLAIEDVESGGSRLFVLGDESYGADDPSTGERLSRLALWSLAPGGEKFQSLGDLGERRSPFSTILYAGAGRVFVRVFERSDLSYSLWGSDGTAGSAELLARVPQNTRLFLRVWAEPLVLPEGRAFLENSDAAHGIEPWTSDGTADGTTRLADLCPGECDSLPRGLGTVGREGFLFSATDGVHGHEPWLWRPATGDVGQVVDLCPGECSGSPRLVGEPTEDRMLLVASDPERDRELWEVDPGGSNARILAYLGELEVDIFEVLYGSQNVLWGVTESHWIFWGRSPETGLGLWSVPIGASAAPPAGPALTSDALPGFAVKVRIGGPDGRLGRAEPDCLPETLCVSGAVEGRSEVFVRVVGPKPNGRLWPTLVKFTTSKVEVWIEQLSTGIVRYYELEGASLGNSDLPGRFDRDGFPPS